MNDMHRINARRRVYFADYLTDLEGSICDVMDEIDIVFTPFKHQRKGYMEQAKQACQEIDDEQA